MFRVLLLNTNNSIQHYSFISTQLNYSKYCYVSLTIQLNMSFVNTHLNGQAVLFLTIQFNVSHLFAHRLNVQQICFAKKKKKKLMKDSFVERRVSVCNSNYRVADCKDFFLFTHLESGRKGPGSFYCHRIDRNVGGSLLLWWWEKNQGFFFRSGRRK